MAEHRVDSCSCAARLRTFDRRARPRRHFGDFRIARAAGTHASGGSSSRIVTGRPFMSRNSSTKSSRCIGSSLASAARRPASSSATDHLAHRDDPLGLEEHVLGPAQADALGAELARRRASSGFPHWLRPSVRTSSAHSIRSPKVTGQLRLDRRRPRPGSSAPPQPSMVIGLPAIHVTLRADMSLAGNR